MCQIHSLYLCTTNVSANTHAASYLNSQGALDALALPVKMYREKLTVEKKNAETLGRQVRKLKAMIGEKRRNMGGVNAAKENHAMVQKQIRILENRLDKVCCGGYCQRFWRFHCCAAPCCCRRPSLNSMKHWHSTGNCDRKLITSDRSAWCFDNIYRKLEKDLQEKKKDMVREPHSQLWPVE